MCSPSPPPAPDYTAAANATASGNLDAVRAQTAANRVNQVTPYGNLTYTHDTTGTLNTDAYNAAMQQYYDALNAYNSGASTGSGTHWGGHGGTTGTPGSKPSMPNQADFMTGGNPDSGWTATQTLSPEQQKILDQNTQLTQGLLGTAQSGLNYANDVMSHPGIDQSKLPQMPINPGETYMDAYNRYMQPNWDRQQSQLQNQLANQGITMGSEAYGNSMRDLHDQQARDQLGAITTGMNTGLAANQQAFGQAGYNQMQPINVINALRTGNQVQSPNYTSVPQQSFAAGPDLLGAAQNQYNAALGGYNAEQAGNANMMNGLFGLGSAAIMGF